MASAHSGYTYLSIYNKVTGMDLNIENPSYAVYVDIGISKFFSLGITYGVKNWIILLQTKKVSELWKMCLLILTLKRAAFDLYFIMLMTKNGICIRVLLLVLIDGFNTDH